MRHLPQFFIDKNQGACRNSVYEKERSKLLSEKAVQNGLT